MQLYHTNMSVAVLVALLLVWHGETRSSDGNSEKTLYGKAPISGTAKLKCDYETPVSGSRSFYWQRGRKENSKVVFELTEGKLVTKHVDHEYQSRTSLQQNYDVNLYNVTWEDEGRYDCVIINRTKASFGSKFGSHKSVFILDVFANFSMPEISPESPLINIKKGAYIDLNCSSRDGFPKPETMYWEFSDGNITWTRTPPPQIVNINYTFTVSSNLVLPKVEHSVNITCILKAHHMGMSPVIQIVVAEEPVPKNPNFFLIMCVVILIFLSVLFIILTVYKNRRKCTPESSHRIIATELGENNTRTSNAAQAEESLMLPEHQATNAS